MYPTPMVPPVAWMAQEYIVGSGPGKRTEIERGVASSEPPTPDSAPAPPKEIPLGRGMVALVDARDYARLSAKKWYAHKSRSMWYASRNQVIGGVTLMFWMHREILRPPPGMVVDHINRNGLDNRLDNLRVCTIAENLRNSAGKPGRRVSKYKGVSPHPRRKGLWRARVQLYLGTFATEEEAGRAYDAWVAQNFGPTAFRNFAKGSDGDD